MFDIIVQESNAKAGTQESQKSKRNRDSGGLGGRISRPPKAPVDMRAASTVGDRRDRETL